MRALLVVAALVSFLASTAPVPAEEPTPASAAPGAGAVREIESRFLAIPSPDNMREAMRRLSARPHHVGSAYGRENAEWILARFREWGWDARIETFDVLFPTPKERLVEMVAPTRFRLALEEPAVSVDPTSGQKAEQLPTYNAYSIDGDVTGPLVYVNYGLPEDYEQLDRLGISVKGAIVLARYGRSWRGIKPKVAAEHGAVGCLIYSDPRDDGYFEGRRLPEGPHAPEGRRAAGERDGLPLLEPGRPADTGRGGDEGGEAAAGERGAEPHPDSRAAHLLRGRAAAPRRARGAAGARGLAGRSSDHVPRGPGSGEGPPEGGVQLGHQAGPRRRGPHPGGRAAGRVGRARATTTTPG